MRLNALIYKYFKTPNSNQNIRLHLGPGRDKYIPGWINLDANIFTGKSDIWVDLRFPLPFWDATVDAIYSHHMIEHLPNLAEHFSDVYRCLKPGATYRVGGPNGDSAIRKFCEADKDWFYGWPDDRSSVGGRFENFIFCRGEHLTILTYSYLEELLSNAGFTNIRACIATKETDRPNLFQDVLRFENETDFEAPHTIIVEADRPEGGS